MTATDILRRKRILLGKKQSPRDSSFHGDMQLIDCLRGIWI